MKRKDKRDNEHKANQARLLAARIATEKAAKRKRALERVRTAETLAMTDKRDKDTAIRNR